MPRPMPPLPPVTRMRLPSSNPLDMSVVHTANREAKDTLVRSSEGGKKRLRISTDEAQGRSAKSPRPRDELRNEPRCHLEHAGRKNAVADAHGGRQGTLQGDHEEVGRMLGTVRVDLRRDLAQCGVAERGWFAARTPG